MKKSAGTKSSSAKGSKTSSGKPKTGSKPAAPPKVAKRPPEKPVKPAAKPEIKAVITKHKPIPITIKSPQQMKQAAKGAAAAAVIKGGKPASAPAGKSPPPKIDPKTGKPVDQKPAGPKQRYSVMTADAMAASRAAAAKLAAAAGLHPVKSTSNGDAPVRNYTRQTKSPFDKKELAEFREMLLTKRRQIEGDVNAMESEALSGGGGSLSHLPQHMADQGTDTFDQSLALDLAASQRGLLKEIDDALARIEAGTYGICEEMGKPISVERLRHTPWARYCIEAARQHERAAYFR